MNASRVLLAVTASLAVAGAATMAIAQTTTPNTTPNTTGQNQGQGTSQMQGQTPNATTRDSTLPGSVNSATQRPADSTMGTGNPRTSGTNGTTGLRSGDDTMRTPSDRSTMGSERAARADRN